MKDKPLVILCRHGSTKLNATSAGESAERIRGWSDVALDSRGKEDAHKLADKLVKYDIEVVYCSPLQRALETGEAISEKLNVPLQLKRALMPWDLGVMTKQLVKDVLPIMKDHIIHENKKVPMGESFSTFKRRCLSFIKACCLEAHRDNKIIVCCAHTRNLQLVRAWLANGAPDNFRIDLRVMDDYSKEVEPGGFEEISPHMILGPEFRADGKHEDSIE